jgi:hypothetical protein
VSTDTCDDPEEARDRQLEPAVPVLLQRQDRERDRSGDQPGSERRHTEQQVERDRGPHELGEVGRDRDDLRLRPQPPRRRARQVRAAQLRQVHAGRDADLGRQVLHEHRHQVRGDDHPDEQEAVLRAAGDVRREVAGIDVGDGRDERRAEQRQPPAHGTAPPHGLQLGQRRSEWLDELGHLWTLMVDSFGRPKFD